MNTRLKMSLLALVIIGGSLVGCNTANATGEETIKQEGQVEQEGKFEYSNLIDNKTQKEVADRLLKVGVSQESINTFLEWTNDFNKRAGQPEVFKEGFTLADTMPIDYEDVILTSEDDTELQTDTNCRITAYLLFKDFVEIESNEEADSYLMFDIEAIDNNPIYETIKVSREKFITLFNPIQVQEGTDSKKHGEQIQEEWEKRGITFEENARVSLINLFLHDPYENKRFVGHTGILIEDNEGILFVEKYGPFAPYQASKFSSQEELVDYLLSRKDIYGDDTEAKPIVMKNAAVI